MLAMKRGYTLIEILIVLAIVGILASIAYPSYQNHLIRSRRSDGQSALLDLANRMESYYSDHKSYQLATIGSGSIHDILNRTTTPGNGYTLEIVQATENTYILQATPIGPQAKADTFCQSLTFNYLGTKGIASGPAGSPMGTVEQCW